MFKVKSKLENMLSQTTKPSKVADKCLRLREERYGIYGHRVFDNGCPIIPLKIVALI